MNSTIYSLFFLALAVVVVISQKPDEEDFSEMDKRARSFAFAKRFAFGGPGRSFAFAKRSADNDEEEATVDNVEKRARSFAFAKRGLRPFAFAKRFSSFA